MRFRISRIHKKRTESSHGNFKEWIMDTSNDTKINKYDIDVEGRPTWCFDTGMSDLWELYKYRHKK